MQLLRHLLGYAPAKLAAIIVAFGGVYAFTRLLGAEGYGRYSLMISVQALIHTLTLTWAEAAAFRFTVEAEKKGELGRHIRTALGLIGKSLIVTALALGLTALIFRNDPDYLAILPWLAVLIPANAVIQLALEIHRARHQVRRYVAIDTGVSVIGFVLGVVIAAQGQFGAAAPFIGMALIRVIAALFEGRWLFGTLQGAAPDRTRTRDAVLYGLPIAMALALDLLLSAGDRFLLAYFLGEEAVGAYAAGYGVADKTVLMICAWAAMAGSPLILSAWERGEPDAARTEARGLVSFILLLGLPAATGLALVATPLAEVMIAEDLREQARETIPWIAFAGLFNGLLIHYWTEAFQLARKTGERALLMIIPTVANLIANLILIPWIGLMGAVYATLGSYVLGNLVLALAGRRHVALPLPLADLARLGLAAAAMSAVVLLLPDLGGLAELLLKAACGGAVYFIAALALNAGGARDWMTARRQTWSNPDETA